MRSLSHIIVGLNIALATITSGTLALHGEPGTAIAICAMLAAVYGVENTMKSIRRVIKADD